LNYTGSNHIPLKKYVTYRITDIRTEISTGYSWAWFSTDNTTLDICLHLIFKVKNEIKCVGDLNNSCFIFIDWKTAWNSLFFRILVYFIYNFLPIVFTSFLLPILIQYMFYYFNSAFLEKVNIKPDLIYFVYLW
jgi:hypothetical protein